MASVIFVDTEMGQEVGGAQTFLARLLPTLDHRGYETTVITSPDPFPSYGSVLRGQGVSVQAGSWRYSRLVPDAARCLAGHINEITEAVYVVSVSSGIGWAAIPLLRPDIPALVICHSDAETFYTPAVHYAPALDTVIGVSAPIVEILGGRGFEAERLALAPYGVEPHSLHKPRSPHSPLQVTFIGRMDEDQKALSVLAATAKLVVDHPIEFHFAGEGADLPQFRRSLGGHPRVTFYGALGATEVHTLLEKMDCLVLTSRYEGMPLSALEALSHGVVPVLSDISAHRALVRPGVDGLLTPPNDPEALAEALIRLASDHDSLARLSRAAHEVSTHFSVDAMADAYEVAFRQAAQYRSLHAPRQPLPLMASCHSRWPMAIRRARAWMVRYTSRAEPGAIA